VVFQEIQKSFTIFSHKGNQVGIKKLILSAQLSHATHCVEAIYDVEEVAQYVSNQLHQFKCLII